MSQLTEYFLAKDLAQVFKELTTDNDHGFEEVFETKVSAYKAACFP